MEQSSNLKQRGFTIWPNPLEGNRLLFLMRGLLPSLHLGKKGTIHPERYASEDERNHDIIFPENLAHCNNRQSC